MAPYVVRIPSNPCPYLVLFSAPAAVRQACFECCRQLSLRRQRPVADLSRNACRIRL